MMKVYKNVCITGAGNGIGRAIAIAMSNEGYNVACADIDLKQAQDTVDLISNKQNSGIAVATDVTKVFDIKNMINKTVEAFGSLDILVNNAGVTRTSNIMDLTEKDWDWIHNVNAKGTFFCLQVAASQMIKQNKGGRIINMASVGGKGFVDVSNAIYAASKGAVISLTKTAAQELAKYEITVNAICPGITHTNILSGIVKKRALEQNKSEEEIMKHYVRDIPLKRPNEPEDIAEMVVFLSSKGARNISGQSYNVDGGLIPS
jgi:NAD(P)-dependent dehydrogenase (short-subunit alcohol dehydrogenase family)